jgi:hypothetical protein
VITFVNDKYFQLVHIDHRELECSMTIFRKGEALLLSSLLAMTFVSLALL